jgi:hypothetical protein
MSKALSLLGVDFWENPKVARCGSKILEGGLQYVGDPPSERVAAQRVARHLQFEQALAGLSAKFIISPQIASMRRLPLAFACW